MDPTLHHHEFDSPWKNIISSYFEQFMIFFFPKVAIDIDWSVPPISLDKELESLIRTNRRGRQIVDKLMQVVLLNGEQVAILIHIEVQGTREHHFEQRMFNYWCAIRLHYDLDVFSCAILTDRHFYWRPKTFRKSMWTTQVQFEFPTVKILDYQNQMRGLEKHTNPFALAVLAHLKTLHTSPDDPQRADFKFQLFRILYEKKYSRTMILEFMAFLDWVILLIPVLDEQFTNALSQFEKENQMEYIPSWSRSTYQQAYKEGRQDGHNKGLEEGREKGLFEGRIVIQNGILATLTAKFGPVREDIKTSILAIEDLSRLQELIVFASTSDSLSQFESAFFED